MGVWTIPTVVLFAIVTLQVEWLGRARLGVEPKGWRSFLKLLSKKTSPDPRATAFAFAVAVTWFFALWEGLLRAGLDLQGPEWRLAPALLLGVVGVASRRLRPAQCSLEEVLLLLVATQLALGAWFSFLGLVWVVYRGRPFWLRTRAPRS